VQTEIEQRTGYEARMTQLGHLLRGGTPSAYDRVIATRFGVEAIDAVHDRDFGVMVALHGTDVVRVPLEAGVAQLKTVDQRLFDTAAVFFG
jgi:6-phosphofructokinase 1